MYCMNIKNRKKNGIFFFMHTFTTKYDLLLAGTAKIPKNSLKLPEGLKIEIVNEDNFELIKIYDKQFHSIDRSDLLRIAFIKPPFRRSKIAIRDGKCVGYGCIRYSDGSWNNICPLVGENASIAEMILQELISDFKLEGQQLDIYIPAENSNQAVPLLGKYGIDKPQEVLPMMSTDVEKGNAICEKIPWNKLFGHLVDYVTMI